MKRFQSSRLRGRAPPVVLFVGGKDQIIQHFTTGNRGIVPQHRVDEPCSVFQIAVVPQYKADSLGPAKYPATVADDAVHQFTSSPNFEWLVVSISPIKLRMTPFPMM
jgi:hypothetical protein